MGLFFRFRLSMPVCDCLLLLPAPAKTANLRLSFTVAVAGAVCIFQAVRSSDLIFLLASALFNRNPNANANVGAAACRYSCRLQSGFCLQWEGGFCFCLRSGLRHGCRCRQPQQLPAAARAAPLFKKINQKSIPNFKNQKNRHQFLKNKKQ
ncbi:hypothetical protein MmiHf6_09880 [Methanimicrococcus hongohii]|uniref:Uncharacterized protein n=1 Tax=Methanimicrococcus hongohii TaxID=3028295 RepID=A0AA96ZSQ7_9EURY|nr:hypothetical protein MmiHf6_09880 [Methanimicrococcus sp. Hf6]